MVIRIKISDFIMVLINMDGINNFTWVLQGNILIPLFSLFFYSSPSLCQIFFKGLYVFFVVAESHTKRFVGGFHSVVYGRVQPQPKNTTTAPLAPGDAVSMEMMFP